MRFTRTSRRILLAFSLYLSFCIALGILITGFALHPPRRPLAEDDEAAMRSVTHDLDSDLSNVSITTPDHVTLRAWIIHPHHANGNGVILLHGVGDNRLGMTGYAQLLLAHGYTVLLPDARAHGISGGDLATYGLLERNDIHQWFDFLAAQDLSIQNHLTDDPSHCIYGLGESMGAAQLLQSLPQTNFCGVVAESSFSNFREIAYDRMGQPFHLGPWVGRSIFRPLVEIAFLRARWKFHVNMEQASPEDAVAATRVPVLLIHGQVDSNIPVRHSRRIQVRNPDVVVWEVPHADHCGAFSVDPRQFEQRVLSWFSSHSQPTNRAQSTTSQN
jgi:uncharacterized protein